MAGGGGGGGGGGAAGIPAGPASSGIGPDGSGGGSGGPLGAALEFGREGRDGALILGSGGGGGGDDGEVGVSASWGTLVSGALASLVGAVEAGGGPMAPKSIDAR